jgi:hypothetical protein
VFFFSFGFAIQAFTFLTQYSLVHNGVNREARKLKTATATEHDDQNSRRSKKIAFSDQRDNIFEIGFWYYTVKRTGHETA